MNIKTYCFAVLATNFCCCSPLSSIEAAQARGDTEQACHLAQVQSDHPEVAVFWAECLLNGTAEIKPNRAAALQYLAFSARSGNNAAAQKLQSLGEKIPPEYFASKENEQRRQANTPLFINGPGSCYGAWGGRYSRLGYGCW
jgi:hypothetical protein